MEQDLTIDMLIKVVRQAVRSVLKEEGAISTRPKLTPDFITMNELCVLLRVSKVTVHTWKKNGIIPFEKICGKLLFDKQEILYQIKENPMKFGGGRDYPYRKIKG